MLPDGRCFLYYARGDREHRGIYVASLDGGEPARIVESMFNAVYASGHLITMRDGVVVAYPFDEESARLTGDIWVADLDRAALTRLTLDPSNDLGVVWSADGGRIGFRSDRSGNNFLYGMASTGATAEQQLTNYHNSNPTDWSADGKTLVFHQSIATTNTDIGITALAMNEPPTFLVKTVFEDYDGRLSPDGRWLAYVSDESGQPAVYVQTYPLTGPDALTIVLNWPSIARTAQ